MALELWIPNSAMPTHKCETCGKPFYEGEDRAWIAHCKKCVEENLDRLNAEQQYLRDFSTMEGKADHEYEDWVKKMGRVR